MVDKIKNTNNNTNINNIKILVPTTKPRRKYTSKTGSGGRGGGGLDGASQRLSTLQNRATSSGVQPNISVGGPTIMIPSAPVAPVATTTPPVAPVVPRPPITPRPPLTPRREPVEPVREEASVSGTTPTRSVTFEDEDVYSQYSRTPQTVQLQAQEEVKGRGFYGARPFEKQEIPLTSSSFDPTRNWSDNPFATRKIQPQNPDDVRRVKTGDFNKPYNPNEPRFYTQQLHGIPEFISTDINDFGVSPMNMKDPTGGDEDFSVSSKKSLRSVKSATSTESNKTPFIAGSVSSRPQQQQKEKRVYNKKSSDEKERQREKDMKIAAKRMAGIPVRGKPPKALIQRSTGAYAPGYEPKQGGGGEL